MAEPVLRERVLLMLKRVHVFHALAEHGSQVCAVAGQHAAVDGQQRAGDHAGPIAGQERHVATLSFNSIRGLLHQTGNVFDPIVRTWAIGDITKGARKVTNRAT